MTAFSEIAKLLDQPHILDQLACEHRDIFETAFELYERSFRKHAKQDDSYHLRRLRHFLERLANLEAQSKGYFELHEKVGARLDYDLATDFLKRGLRCHGLAYVYGYAVLRMNRLPDGAIYNQTLEEFARTSLRRIEKAAINVNDFPKLAGALKAAEAAGWLGKPNLRPVMVIGANWCPDTAVSVVEVANAFDVRLELLFMDYLKPSRDSGKRANGYFMTHDHALANFEDGYKAFKAKFSSDRARIPLVVYSNGSRDEEPTVTRFATQLAEFGYI